MSESSDSRSGAGFPQPPRIIEPASSPTPFGAMPPPPPTPNNPPPPPNPPAETRPLPPAPIHPHLAPPPPPFHGSGRNAAGGPDSKWWKSKTAIVGFSVLGLFGCVAAVGNSEASDRPDELASVDEAPALDTATTEQPTTTTSEPTTVSTEPELVDISCNGIEMPVSARELEELGEEHLCNLLRTTALRLTLHEINADSRWLDLDSSETAEVSLATCDAVEGLIEDEEFNEFDVLLLTSGLAVSLDVPDHEVNDGLVLEMMESAGAALGAFCPETGERLSRLVPG